MLVFLNGQILKEEDAKISINDLSYQFGYGLFETIRCEQGIPLFFEYHYKRLTHSAKELEMSFPVEEKEVKKWIQDILHANKLTSGRVKIIISKRIEDKFNVLILTSPLEKLPGAYSLLSYTLSRDSKSVSFRHKTTSRADSYVAYKKAIESDFNDALYVNERNELIECTRANIFLVIEDKIITPLLESGILSGVTRAKIIEIAKKEGTVIEEKNVHSLYLGKAADAFITNAIIGIMPVSRIKFEDKEYNFSRDSKTIRLKNAYDGEVQEYLNASLSKHPSYS
ncbi:MAG: aminotransferase class IV [Candidatus Melainabacteria bacterium]|nr:aminotransferase class IV [Candidatus Melainabacteria bacterium]